MVRAKLVVLLNDSGALLVSGATVTVVPRSGTKVLGVAVVSTASSTVLSSPFSHTRRLSLLLLLRDHLSCKFCQRWQYAGMGSKILGQELLGEPTMWPTAHYTHRPYTAVSQPSASIIHHPYTVSRPHREHNVQQLSIVTAQQRH